MLCIMDFYEWNLDELIRNSVSSLFNFPGGCTLHFPCTLYLGLSKVFYMP